MKFTFILLMLSTFWVYETNNDVNLRKGPDNKKRVIRTVSKGEPLKILEQTNQWWWKVEYQGKKGYIASSFITRSYSKTTVSIIQKYPYESLLFLVIVIIAVIITRKNLNSSK